MQFDWTQFYGELAHKLLPFRDKRQQLVTMVKGIYEMTGINMPTLERENRIVDIDPFAVFGLFNKSSMKESNRILILSALAKRLGVIAALPTAFNSIPVLNNQNATFYSFIGERGDKDIDALWMLFASALSYADEPTAVSLVQTSKRFDIWYAVVCEDRRYGSARCRVPHEREQDMCKDT